MNNLEIDNKLISDLNKYWSLYKTDYSLGTENAKNEIYKWQIFKQVYSNWNWNVEDKKSMILNAFTVSGSNNLWASGNYFPIKMLEGIVFDFPDETIQAFEILFDQNKELIIRIQAFKNSFDELLIKLQDKYPDRDKMKSHYQDIRIISIYLMLQFPEEYIFYKYNVAKDFFKIIAKEGIKKGDDQSFIEFNQLAKEIKNYVQQDVEYLDNYKNFLESNSLYNDSNLNILTQDFIFTIVNHFALDYDVFKNKRKYFIEWLNNKFGEKNGTNSSYVRAIDILNEILNVDLYSIPDINYFENLYQDLISNQKDESGKYYYEKAKSYGEKGFYSASIQTYINFLLEDDNQLNVSISTNYAMNKNVEILKYKKQIILQGSPGTGKTRTAKQIAKELTGVSDINDSDQFKLIQFHPSYTYEDFVRGIVSKPNEEGDGIVYEAENKILAEFAERAYKNYIDSTKDSETLIKESTTTHLFKNFVEFIQDEIEKNNGFYNLTENVGLIACNDEDAFRYKGLAEGWLKGGNRMVFKDILTAYTEGNITRQDIKRNLKLSGLARQHASYFVRVLNLFQEYVSNHREETFKVTNIPLKNYVLIIDEINRANLSSVLGELIYALEYRGEVVESMYEVEGENKIILPPNLYIIGTMNTADRSVGHIDYAIRRRFAFIDILPKDLSDETGIIFDSLLFYQVSKLFDENLSPEFEKKDVQLGHSYFIDKSDEGGFMDIRLEYEIKPILLEYIKDGVLIGDEIKQKIEELEVSI